MGSFANSIFNMLLGWLRSAAATVWSVISGQQSAQAFEWLGENWLGLTIAVCAICTLVDMIIHLLRWRSYKVWASYIRRITGADKRAARRRAEAQCEEERRQKAIVREWIYPDGTARKEEVPVQEADEENVQPWQQLTTEEELEAYRRQFARPSAQPISYRRPAAMDQLQYEHPAALDEPVAAPEGYPEPAPEQEAAAEYVEPQQDVQFAPTQPRESLSTQMRRRVAQLQRNLGMEEDDDMIVTYKSVRPIADVKDTYHDPVYPPNWPNGEQNAAAPRRRRRRSETDAID